MLRTKWKFLEELERQDENVEILRSEILERNLVTIRAICYFELRFSGSG